jgi:hypothetical protein
MKNCFHFKTAGSVNNDNLPFLYEFVFDIKNVNANLLFYYGPKSSSTTKGELVISVSGGKINGETSKTIAANTAVTAYSSVTIVPDSIPTTLTIRINNYLNLLGFGQSNQGGYGDNSPLSLDRLSILVNASRFVIPTYMSPLNLSKLIEDLIANGSDESIINVYNYGNNNYDVYEGDTKINTSSTELIFTINASKTEYTIVDQAQPSVLLAKKVYSDGEWVNVSLSN